MIKYQAYDPVYVKLCVCLHREISKMIVNTVLTAMSQYRDISKDSNLNNSTVRSITIDIILF